VWCHETQPDLSQRTIARTFHVSQPYVNKLLKRVRLSSRIENALGWEAYKHYRERHETQRRAHFQAQGAPASLTGDSGDNPIEAIHVTAPRSRAVILEKVDETGVHQFARTTTGEVVEVYDSARGCNAPARTGPAYIPPSRPFMVTKDMYVADQCPSFGRR